MPVTVVNHRTFNAMEFRISMKRVVDIQRPCLFGNPYPVGEDGTREEVIEKFRLWFWEKINNDYNFYTLFVDLAQYSVLGDLYLMCCCKPLACHGDVIRKALIAFNAKKFTLVRPPSGTTTRYTGV